MRFLYAVVGWLLLAAPILSAQTPAKLRVGIFDRPPFAAKTADGQWEGLAVEVWERISAELGLPFEYVETPLDRIVDDAAAGRLDVIVGEMSVSADRARRLEFSQPYLSSPAAVAFLKKDREPRWIEFAEDVMAHGVGTLLLVLLASLLIFSVTLWLVERRVDDSHFGGDAARGFGAALWFAAVTITTVGYGDKTPRSALGRAVVFFWMFIGVVMVSVFTGAVASSLAVARLDGRITQASDLVHYRTGVLDGSLARNVLTSIGVPNYRYPTVEAGLQALDAKQITAFADSELTLRYLVNHDYAGKMLVQPLPTTHLAYAFATRPNFPAAQLRAINIALIGQVERPDWQQTVDRWAGPPAR
ncbi:MAG TPA: transporter substrate-binding domain-containing protein [Chthoniobacterales bacterium]|jgi:ABC-type amino acid transport substrate-binding protein